MVLHFKGRNYCLWRVLDMKEGGYSTMKTGILLIIGALVLFELSFPSVISS